MVCAASSACAAAAALASPKLPAPPRPPRAYWMPYAAFCADDSAAMSAGVGVGFCASRSCGRGR